MARYYSTFISGLGEIISQELLRIFPQTEIEVLLDGLIVYKTSASIEEIKNLKFFNNSFCLLHFFKQIEPGSLQNMIKFVYQSDFLKRVAIPKVEGRNRTFRVIVSKENELGVVNPNILKNIEEKLAKGTGLTLDRSKPQLEFWFLERSEGVGFFGLRITYKHSTLNLNPGQLRTELAHLLCILSEPNSEDVFLDPFCGWGSIPLARKDFPYTKIFCSDLDTSKVEQVKKLGLLRPRVCDATNLSFVTSSSISKIVTDPPWGLAEKVDVDDLYGKMLQEFLRIMRPDGILVILTSKKLVFENLLNQYLGFRLLEKYDILVSGKKAAIYKIRKNLASS